MEAFNKNVVSEVNELKNNMDKTADMRFASDLPVLLFTTKEDKVSEDGKNLGAFYKTQLTDSPSSKVVALEGHHDLHWTRYKEMSKEVNEFIRIICWQMNPIKWGARTEKRLPLFKFEMEVSAR
ncbi:MAG: hypothetical protein ACOYEF_14960 [Planifilum sp.]